jgi:conjugal transfer pilus assembly protein TraK
MFCQASFALQTISVVDNETAQAFIPEKGLTRLAIDHGRITEMRGTDGIYKIDAKDLLQGALFFHVIASPPQPFTVFIDAEHHHHYVLHLTPRDQDADTILLEPKGTKTASHTPTLVTQLMKALASHSALKGYAITREAESSPSPLKETTLQRVSVYKGAHLNGHIYRVTNQTNAPLTLTEKEFYRPGDRAIALAVLTLAPQASTWLYKVVNHG